METGLKKLGANIKRITDDQFVDGLPVVETIPAKKLIQTDR
jgi:hypothetical protein